MLKGDYMDIRTDILQKVTQVLIGKVENGIIELVQDTLIIELNAYELTERCTEVAVRDDSAEGMLNKYIATKRVEGKSEKTLRRYREQDLALLNFLGKPLEKITTDDIRFYLSVKRQRDKLKNSTLDGMRRCYNSLFGWLTDERIIPYNPCASISQIKSTKVIRKPFSPAEIDRMRRACDNIRDLALLDFLYSTGCRVSEVENLNITDVDFSRRECVVLGKGNKQRTVYLTEVAAENLQEYLNSRKDFDEALFTGKGNRMKKSGIEALVKRLGKKAGVENAHPHRYRRTLATNLLDRGMNIQDVAAILGHADLKTTQVYCYISQINVKSAYCKYAA